MMRKKVPWNEGKMSICAIYDLPKTTMIEDLSPLLYEQIYKDVSDDPDRS